MTPVAAEPEHLEEVLGDPLDHVAGLEAFDQPGGKRTGSMQDAEQVAADGLLSFAPVLETVKDLCGLSALQDLSGGR